MRCKPFLLVPALLLSLAAEEAPTDFPNMAPSVGALLEHDYYDQSRFKPRLMVERALRALEASEISIDTLWAQDAISLRIAGVNHQVAAPEPKSLDEAMVVIERVRLAVEAAKAFPAKQTRELGYAMLNGALSSLDPHTVLMPPEPAGDFDEDMRGEFGGIGAYLNQDPTSGDIAIERVMPDRPAEKGGVQDGDVIIAVNGESTVGLSLDQAVRRIKGPKGTTVALTLRRKNQVVELPIVRDIVQVVTIRSWRAGEVGYVRMDEFNHKTYQDLTLELSKLQEGGALKALVLDLRANSGGLLEQARVISDLFLPKNCEIVRTLTVGGEPHIYKSSARVGFDAPMVVLTGGGSASAAEIVAGALQRNDRALVAGGTTFGKGSVQTVRPLIDHSRLKLTIQEYQLPGGVSIQDVGVTPDLRLVRRALRKDGSVDLVPYTSMREVDDEFALSANHTYQHASSLELGWMAETLTKEEGRLTAMSSRAYRPDQEAMVLIDLLGEAVTTPATVAAFAKAKADGTFRQALLEALRAPVERRAEQESRRLAETLATAKPAVTWGPDAEIATGTLAVRYDGPAEVSAGESVELRFTVSNRGGVEVGRLYGLIKADKTSPLYEEEVVFGGVAAGGETVGTFAFEVPPRSYAGEERFTLELYRDGHRDVLATVAVTVAVREKPRPHFSYAWKLIEPSGDGSMAPGEACQLEVTLRNSGEGDSLPVNLSVYKDNDPWVSLGGGSFKLDPVAAGKSVTVSVPVTVLTEASRAGQKERFANTSVALQLNAEERFPEEVDARFRANLYHKLTLPVNTPFQAQEIIQPRLELTGITARPDGSREVAVRLVDDNAAWIATFQDENKIDLQACADLKDGVYRVTFVPKPGLNLVRVLTTDRDEVSELLPLRVWGPEAAAPVARQPSSSKLDGSGEVLP